MKTAAGFISLLFILLAGMQSAGAQTFRAGFTLGAVRSDVDGMDSRDRDNDFHKLGFVAGGIISSALGKRNVFQMEMNYIQKGTVQPPDSMNNGYYKLGIDYVEVPFMIRHHFSFNIGKMKIDRFDWEAGASIARMVRHDWVLDNYPAPLNLSNMNRTDVSLMLGANYNFSSRICLNIRYTNSVIPAIKHNVIPSYLMRYYFNSGNNMVIHVSLKFIFGGSAEKGTD
jgi:Outer membrane protein beta-barrel domain